MARKKEYIAIVSTNMISKLMKNCDAVLARFAMLQIISCSQATREEHIQVHDEVEQYDLDKHEGYIHNNLS